jgi:hypothetical protein
MVKRRKPGGGRKPNPNKKVMFSTRLEPHVMAALKAGAEKWGAGKNVSAFTERLISDGLQDLEYKARDPALRGLIYFIAQLAEKISGPVVLRRLSKEFQSTSEAYYGGATNASDLWRTDPFHFIAFKVAVKKLLDALEEPPGEIRSPIPGAERQKARFGTDELGERMRKGLSTPEEYGAFNFELLWEQSQRSSPFSDFERKLYRGGFGEAFLRTLYTLPRALRDLELKPKTTKPQRGRK